MWTSNPCQSRRLRGKPRGTIKLTKAFASAGPARPAGVPLDVDLQHQIRFAQKVPVFCIPPLLKIGTARPCILMELTASRGEATDVDLKITGEGMPAKDLEAFLPAIGVNLPKRLVAHRGETLNTNLIVKGPTNKLVTDGNHRPLNNAKLSGFDSGLKKCPRFLPLTGLKTGKDMDIEKMSTNVHMAPTGLRR